MESCSIRNHPFFTCWLANSDVLKAKHSWYMLPSVLPRVHQGKMRESWYCIGYFFLMPCFRLRYCPLVTSIPFMDSIQVSPNVKHCTLVPLFLWFTLGNLLDHLCSFVLRLWRERALLWSARQWSLPTSTAPSWQRFSGCTRANFLIETDPRRKSLVLSNHSTVCFYYSYKPV